MARSRVRLCPTEHWDVLWFFSLVSLFSLLLSTRDTNSLGQVSILGGVWWSEVREATRANFRAYLSKVGLGPPSRTIWIGAEGPDR